MTMMCEVIEIQFKGIPDRPNHASEELNKLRLPIRRQSHHLVLIAIVRESQVHRDGRVEETQRVRIVDTAQLLPIASFGVSGHRAGKIPHSVDRQHRCLVERGDQEPSGDVGLVMLDPMKLGPNRRTGYPQPTRELILQTQNTRLPPESIEDGTCGWQMANHIPEPPCEVGFRIERDRHVVDIPNPDPSII